MPVGGIGGKFGDNLERSVDEGLHADEFSRQAGSSAGSGARSPGTLGVSSEHRQPRYAPYLTQQPTLSGPPPSPQVQWGSRDSTQLPQPYQPLGGQSSSHVQFGQQQSSQGLPVDTAQQHAFPPSPHQPSAWSNTDDETVIAEVESQLKDANYSEKTQRIYSGALRRLAKWLQASHQPGGLRAVQQDLTKDPWEGSLTSKNIRKAVGFLRTGPRAVERTLRAESGTNIDIPPEDQTILAELKNQMEVSAFAQSTQDHYVGELGRLAKWLRAEGHGGGLRAVEQDHTKDPWEGLPVSRNLRSAVTFLRTRKQTGSAHPDDQALIEAFDRQSNSLTEDTRREYLARLSRLAGAARKENPNRGLRSLLEQNQLVQEAGRLTRGTLEAPVKEVSSSTFYGYRRVARRLTELYEKGYLPPVTEETEGSMRPSAKREPSPVQVPAQFRRETLHAQPVDLSRTAFVLGREVYNVDLGQWETQLATHGGLIIRHQMEPEPALDNVFPLRDPRDPVGRVHRDYADTGGFVHSSVRLQGVQPELTHTALGNRLSATTGNLSARSTLMPQPIERVHQEVADEMRRLIENTLAPRGKGKEAAARQQSFLALRTETRR